MTTPVTLQPIPQPPRAIPARAQLTGEQVAAFQQLLAASGLLALPEGKSIGDLVQFGVTVLPDGSGMLQVMLRAV